MFKFGSLFQPAKQPCIIVSSNGRSGSTLMFDALRRINKRKTRALFEARLDKAALAPDTIVKTHDFPAALSGRTHVKTLFCFGSSRDSALSVYSALDRFGREWVDEHFYNLNASGSVEELFERDVLNQAEQIRQWATFEDTPVMCLNYDAIWTAKPEIESFLGLKFNLPERVQRTPKSIPQDIQTKASTVYDPIDAVIRELPGVFMASKSYATLLDKLPR